MAGQERRETAVVVEKAYDFLLWLLPKVERFPRSFRFSVGRWQPLVTTIAGSDDTL